MLFIDERPSAIPDDFFEPLPEPPPVERVATPPWVAPPARQGRPGQQSEWLRFGVLFADGTKATTAGTPWRALQSGERPDGPVLRQWGGSGGGDDHVVDTSWMLWLWPLPPAAPFELIVSWPAFGIEFERQTLEGAAIRRAAEAVQPLVPAQ